ncbi:MAG: PTS sugar transporter subunit IIA [Chlorobi bacterium]|nr:PTS sugar transporter subunit IIA [Chlorobiota bacterium]
MTLTDVLAPERIRIRISVSNKVELLDALLDILVEQHLVLDREAARNAIFEREEKLSTGIGHGIALPHAKTNAVPLTTASLVTCAEAVEYDALDSNPVDIAILLLGPPADVRTHLQLLGKISRMICTDSSVEQFRHAVLDAETAEEAYRALHQLSTATTGA